jgi:hypothetical protein
VVTRRALPTMEPASVGAYLNAAAGSVFETEGSFGELMNVWHRLTGPPFMRHLADEALSFFQRLDRELAPACRSEVARAMGVVTGTLK